jgi:hypothetical protein
MLYRERPSPGDPRKRQETKGSWGNRCAYEKSVYPIAVIDSRRRRYVAYPYLWDKSEVPVAFVQARLAIGAVPSAMIWDGLGSGDVRVTGWPREEKFGS